MTVNVVEHMVFAALSDRLQVILEELAGGVWRQDSSAVIAANRALLSTAEELAGFPSHCEAGEYDRRAILQSVLARLSEIAYGGEQCSQDRLQRFKSGLAYLQADVRVFR